MWCVGVVVECSYVRLRSRLTAECEDLYIAVSICLSIHVFACSSFLIRRDYTDRSFIKSK